MVIDYNPNCPPAAAAGGDHCGGGTLLMAFAGGEGKALADFDRSVKHPA